MAEVLVDPRPDVGNVRDRERVRHRTIRRHDLMLSCGLAMCAVEDV
jgi:hypothetical protein